MDIPSSVTDIDDCAFRNCFSLKQVVLHKLPKYIDRDAFAGCNGVEVVFSEGLESIGKYTFLLCKNLTRVVIPSSVKIVEEGAFRGCCALSEVIFADESSLQRIGESAFRGCEVLKRINLPATVTDAGNDAFAGCITLFEVSFRKVLRFVSENPVERLLEQEPSQVKRQSKW